MRRATTDDRSPHVVYACQGVTCGALQASSRRAFRVVQRLPSGWAQFVRHPITRASNVHSRRSGISHAVQVEEAPHHHRDRRWRGGRWRRGSLHGWPLLAGSLPKPAATANADTNADSADDGEKDAGGRKTASSPLHLVENMVLNPAGSGGSRFLLLSVAFAVKDAEVVKSMTERDPELRDIILRDIGSRDVASLTDITMRDSIKVQLRTAVQKRFGKDAVRDVYFPQFVIQ